MQIEINKNEEIVKEIRQALKNNDGYCPCKIEHLSENRCMCRDFVETVPVGEYCHCGLYKKIEG